MNGLLTPNAVVPLLRVTSKKQVLKSVSEHLAGLTGQAERAIFDVLLERERLGSTGMGRGIAIPHGKLDSLDRVYCTLTRLDPAVDFEAPDDQPVDLVVTLLAPTSCGADHLKALARVSRALRSDTLCGMLRGCDTADGMLAVLAQSEQKAA